MLQIGQILQKHYQLQHQLGVHPMRQTWLAQDLRAQTLVVIKVLICQSQTQWADLKLFEREVRVLQQLNHPRIPRYQDSFDLEDQPWCRALVETYIPGVSLMDLLQQGQHWSEAQIWDMATQVLQILIDLHELNPPILHRDLKPSNLIWGPDQQIYLVDFGAAQERAATGGASFTIVGTYGYTPIEQFGGQAVPASDLYALGATLIHLLTGVPPAELSQDDLRIQFRDKTNISPELRRWLEKLTEPAVKQRFKTARDALSALQSPQSWLSPLDRVMLAPPQLSPRIQLAKSPERLTVTITAPLPGKSAWFARGLVILCSLLFTVVITRIVGMKMLIPAVVIGVIFGSISATVVQFGLTPLFESCCLTIDREGFELTKAQFDQLVDRKKGMTADLLSATVHTYQDDQAKVRTTLALNTAHRRYLLGPGLTESEASWLAQELQDWLESPL